VGSILISENPHGLGTHSVCYVLHKIYFEYEYERPISSRPACFKPPKHQFLKPNPENFTALVKLQQTHSHPTKPIMKGKKEK